MRRILFILTLFLLAFGALACAGKKKDAGAKESSAGGYQVTFIELGSVNCMPCKMMQPVMADIEREFAGKVKVVFYDVWTEQGQPYGRMYGIRVIPTQVFLDRDGKEYYRHEGYFPKEELIKVLRMKGVM